MVYRKPHTYEEPGGDTIGELLSLDERPGIMNAAQEKGRRRQNRIQYQSIRKNKRTEI